VLCSVRIHPRPLLCLRDCPFLVLLPVLGNVVGERVVGVRSAEQGLDREAAERRRGGDVGSSVMVSRKSGSIKRTSRVKPDERDRTREWTKRDLLSARAVGACDMMGRRRMEGSDYRRKYDSQHSADLQSWRPLVLEDIKADTAELV
jgi:hypothetical protein